MAKEKIIKNIRLTKNNDKKVSEFVEKTGLSYTAAINQIIYRTKKI